LRQRLERYDAYWYQHHRQRVLPVLRVGFDDPASTWFHLDPATGELLGRSDTSARSYRWLFNAPHSFDFPVLLAYRPAWDLVVIVLSLAGLVISVSGVVIGWRRLVR
ncbi:PepSY domain-containing protein, partial [Rhodopseudomonas sp. BR0C11]|nr:PepSY domain-containing protein [Rhodopseudomonas sp. BR0C11]